MRVCIIVNACARRLGSRAGPRTGKEERGFRKKREGVFEALPLWEPPTSGTLHGIGLQPLQGIGGGPTGPGGGGEKFGMGKGWVRGKEARSGSACSRRFSAGSRGEYNIYIYIRTSLCT